jgi:hypothetical protein
MPVAQRGTTATPIGVVRKKRVQVQQHCMWTDVEGLPENCTNAARHSAPKIRAMLEDMLHWTLKDTADYIGSVTAIPYGAW